MQLTEFLNQNFSKKMTIDIVGIIALVYVEAEPSHILYLSIVAIVVQGLLEVFKKNINQKEKT